MNEDNNVIYKYNDELYFTVRINQRPAIRRIVKFVCPKHKCPLTENRFQYVGRFRTALECPLCERDSDYKAFVIDYEVEILKDKALALLDQRELAKAKLVRLDDFYVPEIKTKETVKEKESDYFITTEVKTDIDDDTIIVVYIGKKGDKKKTQFFIKPEKLQLSHDYKDLDPACVLSKIELTLKNRTITEDYEA